MRNASKITTAAIIAVLSLAFLTASKPIVWHAPDQITWNDFHSPPDTTSPFRAVSSTGMRLVSGTTTEHALQLTVLAEFDPELSWVQPGSLKPELLAHENGHFNIAEIHARALRKAISAHAPVDPDALSKVLEGLYNSVATKRDAMQEAYDRETEHGIRRTEQAKWDQRIESELKLSKAFADTVVVLKLR